LIAQHHFLRLDLKLPLHGSIAHTDTVQGLIESLLELIDLKSVIVGFKLMSEAFKLDHKLDIGHFFGNLAEHLAVMNE
jgi:hypothetical protein